MLILSVFLTLSSYSLTICDAIRPSVQKGKTTDIELLYHTIFDSIRKNTENVSVILVSVLSKCIKKN